MASVLLITHYAGRIEIYVLMCVKDIYDRSKIV